MSNLVHGSRVRHYEILEELGRGGMGVVYKAHDTKLNRTVALKFLPPHLTADDEATERFVREAQAAAAIDHPNICAVHEISETEDGQTFIVMGYYGGQTLREKLEVGRHAPAEPRQSRGEDARRSAVTSLDEVLSIAAEILEGLSAAHKAGIVHRDIKPGNIILADDGRVRILDFGLAKLTYMVDFTKEGSTSGTAAYMSPEQINGEHVDGRSDLWSLGVILYEMLAGRRPFEGDYAQAVSYAIVNKQAQPMQSAAPDVPDALAAAVDQVLEKDPEQRFQSADEFLEALSPLVAPTVVPRGFFDLAKQPKVAIPLAAFAILLAFLGWRWFDEQAKVRWARQVALPEIERLGNERERADAFRLGLEARQYLKDDPTFKRVFGYVSATTVFETDPPGAELYWKQAKPSDDDWALAGTTPIDSALVPTDLLRVRIQKEGFQTVNRLVYPTWVELEDVTLSPVGAYPADVVRLPGGAPDIRIVGIDHIDAQEFTTVMVDKFEVTNAKFKAFVDAGGYENRKYWDDLPAPFETNVAKFTDRSGRLGPATWEAGAYPEGMADHPVAGVSWFEAMAYAKFAERSLPTVYHWNAAAWTGVSYVIVPASNLAGDGTAPVGSFDGMGRYGTYDLAGNVREWLINPTQDGKRYILGGGWNDPPYAYNDNYAQDPFDRSVTNGFRTMQYLSEEPNLDVLQAQIDQPFRDFAKEKPVSDAEFESILRAFDYDRTPLNSEFERVDDSNDHWILEKITFDAAYGDERVTAYLYLPTVGEPPFQTIVLFPGSNAIHQRVYKVGLTGYSDFLLIDGRAVLLPIYKGTYERGDDLDSDYPEETVFWKEHVVMWAKDLSRSIDYLETRDDIDTENLVYYGFSWGGAMGPIMTAIEPRFKASVLLVAGFNLQKTFPEVDAINFAPRVKAPTLMLNGRYDHFFPLETSQKPLFNLLGPPEDQKRMVVSELGHMATREMLMREMFAWMDRWLDER